MKWHVKSGDIIDEPADILICSANGFLDLSGGVGAAIRMRYGMDMQYALGEERNRLGNKTLPRGEIVTVGPCGTHFKHVIHAIAVDVFYRADIESTAEVLAKAIHHADSLRAKRIAVVALATGYGPLRMNEFGQSITAIEAEPFNPIEEAIVVVRKDEEAEEILEACPAATSFK